MKFKLKERIVGLALAAALLPVLVMSILIYTKKAQVRDMIEEEMGHMKRETIAQAALDVYHMCETANELIQQKVGYDLNVARKILNEKGRVELSEKKAAWKAINQFTSEETSVDLPEMMVGGVWLGQNTDFSQKTPVVDTVKNLVGGTCTIFQKINDKGDMLRVATNVKKLDSTRAIGTFIPAVNPDGTPNPVVSTVMGGNTYRGRAYVVNGWYLTAYEPIQTDAGEIIGLLYVGVRQESVESLRKSIMDIKIGKTGYVGIIGASGRLKGHYIVSKGGKRDGEDIWNAKDPENGTFFIQEIVKKALGLKKGQTAYQSYAWKNVGELISRPKTTALTYFEPWDWIIAAGMYDDDYLEAKRKVEAGLTALLSSVWIGGLIILVMVGSLAVLSAGKMANPITRITEIAQKIAKGDLLSAANDVETLAGAGQPIDENEAVSTARDETGKLLSAVRGMTQNLNALVGQVQKSCIQFVSTATEIAASSRAQEATVNEFGASTNEIVSSSKQISATSRQLVETMEQVSGMSENTAQLAGSGQSGLVDMGSTMQRLEEATRSISSKLTIINEKANNINKVVVTITKIADQTNLLSLNAGIEAEKAGEYGLGFSVVAREIRRLADQTAVSSYDIENMVKEMQSAVSSGVMEMDKFTEEVRQGVGNANNIREHLENIIQQVQSMPPLFDEVSGGMAGQAQGAHQISESMVQLNTAAQQASESLQEFNEATEQLNASAQELQQEISIFKVSA
jgi:methyl-accepting chemotaxis protein